MHNFRAPHQATLNSNIMDHDERINRAITELESSNRINISATARHWGVAQSTLSRRFRGKTVSNTIATSEGRQLLNTAQEKTLIQYINKLTERGFPPTPQLVRNFAQQIIKYDVGENWVARFTQRHRDVLASAYLDTIDHKRKKADNSYLFRHFYDTVSLLFACVAHTYRLICGCEANLS